MLFMLTVLLSQFQSVPTTHLKVSATLLTVPISLVFHSAFVDSKLQIYADSTTLGFVAFCGQCHRQRISSHLDIYYRHNAPYAVGSSIVVANVVPSGYNGTYTVTACGNSTVSFASTYANAYSSGGTISQPGVVSVLPGASGTALADVGITAGVYNPPTFLAAPNYSAPRWRSTDTQPETNWFCVATHQQCKSWCQFIT
jgi:hypothetical protein